MLHVYDLGQVHSLEILRISKGSSLERYVYLFTTCTLKSLNYMNTVIGARFGNRKIVGQWMVGPYTYVLAECQCEHKTRTKIPLGMLVRGKSLNCRKCWHKARRKD